MIHRLGLLVVLFALAIASVAGAYWAIRTRPATPPVSQALLFPELEAALPRLARLQVVYGLGLAGSKTVTLQRQSDGRFVVENYDNYPADEVRVARLLDGLQGLRPLARRTAKAKWHARLGLGDPRELGQAVEVQLLDESGVRLAGVLLGKSQNSEALARQANMRAQSLRQTRNIYIRRIGQSQSFLVAAPWPPTKRTQDWLNPVLPKLDIDDVQRLDVVDGNRNITAARPSMADTFDSKDDDRITPEKIQTLFDNMARLKIEAVAPDASLPPPPSAAQLLLTGFDGTQLRLDIVERGPYGEVRFSAQNSPKAEAWQQRYGAWVYQFAWVNIRPLLLR